MKVLPTCGRGDATMKTGVRHLPSAAGPRSLPGPSASAWPKRSAWLKRRSTIGGAGTPIRVRARALFVADGRRRFLAVATRHVALASLRLALVPASGLAAQASIVGTDLLDRPLTSKWQALSGKRSIRSPCTLWTCEPTISVRLMRSYSAQTFPSQCRT